MIGVARAKIHGAAHMKDAREDKEGLR